MALQPETLWLAPTRPAMKSGVPAEGYFLNVFISLCVGVATAFPPYAAVGVLIHYAVMRPLARWDVNFFRVLRLWTVTKGEAVGLEIYGAPALSALPATRAKTPQEYKICV